ncbi:MAG: hypothetical protein ACRDI2_12495 [Chloroflexota bacterium]
MSALHPLHASRGRATSPTTGTFYALRAIQALHVRVTVQAVTAGGHTRVTASLTDWSGGLTSTRSWYGYLDASGCAGGVIGWFVQKDCTCTVKDSPPPPPRPPSDYDVGDDEGRSAYA